MRSAGSAFAWVYLHQGGRFDGASGLYHFRHRDYSPTLGRWTSLDPLRYAAGDVNLYRFVFNVPTVYTDPSGQLPFLVVFAIAAVGLAGGGTAVYTGIESYRATGNVFDGRIWGAAAEGVVHIGPRVIVNGVSDTVVSAATLGGVDRLEIWPVPPEYREAYEWGYAGSRPLWELEAAVLIRKLPKPTSLQPYVLGWDAGQNGVLVSRGLVDLPELTRHGGGPLRLGWSEGMLLHGPTLSNSIDLGAGLLGLGGNYTTGGRWLPRGAPVDRGVPHPSTPVGRSGSPLSSVQPNAPTTIGGRPCSGHAIDRMQQRGIPPSVVENTIQHGHVGPGSTPGTVVYYDPVNNVSVVVDPTTRRVVTVSWGDLR